jgi:hypothetical protein
MMKVEVAGEEQWSALFRSMEVQIMFERGRPAPFTFCPDFDYTRFAAYGCVKPNAGLELQLVSEELFSS